MAATVKRRVPLFA